MRVITIFFKHFDQECIFSLKYGFCKIFIKDIETFLTRIALFTYISARFNQNDQNCMKTNLNRTITTIDEAKAFLRDLHTNNEVFHPEDNAHDIVWGTTTVSPEECEQLNDIMADIHRLSHNTFDVCGFLLDLDRVNEEYFIKDLSGRGMTTTVSYGDLKKKWDIEQVSNDDEELTLMDWLLNAEVGDEFTTETNQIITRVK